MQQTHPEAMEPAYILFAIPFFFLAIGIEYAWGRFKGHSYYRLNDALTNLNIGVGSQVFSLFQKFVLLGAYTFVYEHFALWRQPQTGWSFVLCLVVFDMFYYWAHRWSHAWNFLWGAHVVHHSSEDFNLSVALRQSWFHNALAFFIFLPIPLMGFDPMIFFAAGAVITLYQFWVHTEAVDRMPAWFELVFNTLRITAYTTGSIPSTSTRTTRRSSSSGIACSAPSRPKPSGPPTASPHRCNPGIPPGPICTTTPTWPGLCAP
jgi:alkylglycerol monooxygenase